MKSYNFRPEPNTLKTRLIERVLLPEWRRIAGVLVAKHKAHHFASNGLHDGNALYKGLPSVLSERYKTAINRQVVGMIKSKIANTKNRFVKVVLRSRMDEATKMKLCFISKHNMFFRREAYASKNFAVSLEDIKLARKVFRGLFGRWPSCKNINMQMQDGIARLEPTGSKRFAYMVYLSTPTKGKPMWVPLMPNTYSNRFQGKLSTAVEFQFKQGKLKAVKLTKEVPLEKLELTGPKLSINIGLKSLIAVNNGESHGMRMLRKLKAFDAKLLKLQHRLKQGHGPKTKLSQFPEYVRLQWRIKSYLKNEVNRILNLLVIRHSPSEISLEDLDFRGAGLSKKLNRLLSRFGLGMITQKLEALKLLGLKVNYIDPAYTSQCCSSCGWVSEKNRKTQARFSCTSCGYTRNADYNASKVVGRFSERFGQEPFHGKAGRALKLKVLLDSFGRGLWRGKHSVAQAIGSNTCFAHLRQAGKAKRLPLGCAV